MRHTVTAALALGLAATATPASAQTLLDKVIQRIGKPRGTAAQGSSTTIPPAALAAISPEQGAAIDQMLTAPVQDAAIVAARTSAWPLIRKLLATGSCATLPAAWNATNRDALTPRDYGGYFEDGVVPMHGLRYHDKSRCLDVYRLADWSKPANNALQFRAYYIAADSGEARNQLFILQQQDGRWLVRTIDTAF
ncbi:hypothetical protein [Sphingomonas bacterium]|uniref:hypothetical protein n=1 Tax=Sphingomonas bacterium TaxID=1895847 RepID=UPI0015754914|nr:hypothetical protein [Sphingomonas bacterium]